MTFCSWFIFVYLSYQRASPLDVVALLPIHLKVCHQCSHRGTGTCFPASHVSSHSVQTSEREKRQFPVCAALPAGWSYHQTPGKYPAEPRKHRLFHYITSERQNCSREREKHQRCSEMSCVQNVVSANSSNLFVILQKSVSVLVHWFVLMIQTFCRLDLNN